MNADINYAKLVEKSLHNVIIDVLEYTKNFGNNGNNFFYISFLTNYPGVEIPDSLKEKYPNEMTIVLQHEFYNLEIEDEFFSVDLSFSGVLHTLKVPYDAISNFSDPYANFALNFTVDETKLPLEKIENKVEPIIKEVPVDNIVSIDAFKKGKKKK